MRIYAKFREHEQGATKGFVDFFVNGSINIYNATLVEGKNGLFVGLPRVKSGEEYHDVYTGVSREFSAQLLEAAIAAKEAPEREATINAKEKAEPYYTARATKLEKDGSCKALASLTVRESKDAEKSAFTIANIRIMEGGENKRLFVSLPSTMGKDDNYHALCSFSKANEGFLNNLIMHEANAALGIKKNPSVDDKLKEAAEKGKAMGQKEKAPEKEMEASIG